MTVQTTERLSAQASRLIIAETKTFCSKRTFISQPRNSTKRPDFVVKDQIHKRSTKGINIDKSMQTEAKQLIFLSA